MKTEIDEQNEYERQEITAKAIGQRRINIIWEATQSVIALMVTSVGMFASAVLAMRSDETEATKAMSITAFLLISNTVFLVIGFYFGRTNHARTGGPHGAEVEDHR